MGKRFYLELRKDPHGPDVALFIGNLPANLSHRQYEMILLDFLDEGEAHSGKRITNKSRYFTSIYKCLYMSYVLCSSLVEGDEGSYLPNCQSNLVIAHHVPTVSIVLYFHKHNSFPFGRYDPLSPVSCRANHVGL